MLTEFPRDSRRPLLLYAGACPKCRFLSRTVVWLSLNVIERQPLEKPEAQKLYCDDYPQARGKPVLFHRGRIYFGWTVFLAVPWLVLQAWLFRFAAKPTSQRRCCDDASGPE